MLLGLFKLLMLGYYVYSFYIATIYIEYEKANPSNHYKKYTVADLIAALISLLTGMMMLF